MRVRCALMTLAAAASAVLGVACGSGTRGAAASPTPAGSPAPTDTPTGCDTAWRVNDPAYAADLLAALQPGGAAVVSNGTLVLSFDGSLPADPGAYETGALYTRRVILGDFDVSVRLDSFAATTSNLTAFFAVQAGFSGGRVLTYLNDLQRERALTWGGGFVNDQGGGAATSGTFRVRRTGSMVVASGGGARSTTTTDTGAMVVGFGIAARNGAAVTGQASARFSNLTVSATTGETCFMNGLE